MRRAMPWPCRGLGEIATYMVIIFVLAKYFMLPIYIGSLLPSSPKACWGLGEKAHCGGW